MLRACGVPEEELRRQWTLQMDAQLSVRAREFRVLALKHPS